jgi:hypothetical protein
LLKTARYVIAGTTEFKDALLPPGNPVRPRRTVLLLDFEGKRFRQETSEEVLSARGGREDRLEYVLRVGTRAFDGRALQGLLHRDVNRIQEDGPDLVMDKDLAMAQFDPQLWPVFFAHGIVPTVHHELTESSSWTRGYGCPTSRMAPVILSMVGERPPSADGALGWWYAGEGQGGSGSADMVLGVREQNYTFTECPPGRSAYGPGRVSNQWDALHFWSLHAGSGANFLSADGAVHFLRYSAAPLMPALASRAGGEASTLPD